MSTTSSNPLLRPSLAMGTRQAPYAQKAVFLVSFFGGPIAAVMMGVLNAHRTGKWRGWLPGLLIVLLLSYLVFEWWSAQTASGRQAEHWLDATLGRGHESLVFRALGLLYFAGIGLAFRREDRAATLMDAPRPDGTWVGMGMIAFGALTTMAVRQVLA